MASTFVQSAFDGKIFTAGCRHPRKGVVAQWMLDQLPRGELQSSVSDI